jgi:sugar porter (SP) family MFS transporter
MIVQSEVRAPEGRAQAGRYSYRLGYIWMISFVAALGGLLFGYDWVVVGGAKPFYEPYFRLSSQEMIGWANSCALLGCLLGSACSGVLMDRYGRKKLLVASAVIFAASSVGTGWAGSFDLFVFWRILGGVGIGIASNVSPTYIAEVAPAQWRGRLVTLNQLTLVIGILAAQVVNLLIAGDIAAGATAEQIRQSWQGQVGWRWMFTAVAVPSLVFLVLALWVPESPRWLVKMGRTQKAADVLARIGGQAYARDEIADVTATVARESVDTASWSALLRPGVFGVVLMGIALAVLQQWSGTNVIFNYAEEIYRGAGYDLSGVMFNIVITGVINLVFTLVATAFVDRLGRRALMLWGTAGLALLHALLGGAFRFGLTGPTVVGLTLGVIGLYAMSLAPVTWVLLSEIFPNRIRGLAMSVAVSSLWIACFLVTFSFPILNGRLGAAGTFWTYAAICFVGFVFIWRCVPETKGKTLEEIEAQLTRTAR